MSLSRQCSSSAMIRIDAAPVGALHDPQSCTGLDDARVYPGIEGQSGVEHTANVVEELL